MKMTRSPSARCVRCLVLATVSVSWPLSVQPPLGAQERHVGISQPVAVAPLTRSGELAILEAEGRLLRLDPGTLDLEVVVRSFAPHRVFDMATALVEGDATMLVTLSWGDSRPAVIRRLVEYSGTRRRRSWRFNLPGTFAGLATSREEETVYIGNSQTGEILRLELSGRREVELWSRVNGVRVLGPLAVDAERDRLLAADPTTGILYGLGNADRESRRLAEIPGQPTALAVDAASGHLFIADPSGRRIWRLDLRASGAVPMVFAQADVFREPIGVAVVGGEVWVADRFQGALYRLSPTGDVRETID